MIVAIMIGAGTFIYLRSDIHRLKYIEHQLKDTYGITCTDGDVSDEFFNVQTTDGITVKGTCSRTGKITAETYINCFYGSESAQRITDEIGDCFDECVIVANNEYLHSWAIPVATGSIGSYEEYLASRDRSAGDSSVKQLHVFVYIRETEDIGHVKDALNILKANNKTIAVIICALSDDKFEAHRDFGHSVYSAGSYMNDLIDSRGSGYNEVLLNETVFDPDGSGYCAWYKISCDNSSYNNNWYPEKDFEGGYTNISSYTDL